MKKLLLKNWYYIDTRPEISSKCSNIECNKDYISKSAMWFLASFCWWILNWKVSWKYSLYKNVYSSQIHQVSVTVWLKRFESLIKITNPLLGLLMFHLGKFSVTSGNIYRLDWWDLIWGWTIVISWLRIWFIWSRKLRLWTRIFWKLKFR